MIYLICPTFASLAYKGALEHVYGKLELAHRARCHAVFFFFFWAYPFTIDSHRHLCAARWRLGVSSIVVLIIMPTLILIWCLMPTLVLLCFLSLCWSWYWYDLDCKGAFGRLWTKVYGGYLLDKYPTTVFGMVRYWLSTLPNAPVWFGTTSIPVPDTWVSSVRPPKIPRVPGEPPPQTRVPYRTHVCLTVMLALILTLLFMLGLVAVKIITGDHNNQDLRSI